jgi:ankyrin repeat protein
MLHIFKYILSDYIDENDKTTLLQSSNIDDFDLPINLLGIDIHWEKDYALIYASENGHLNVVKFLVDKGANIHTQEEKPLILACQDGYIDVVKFLVDKGANIHSRNEYAFISACYYGHLTVVKFLVDKCADIHTQHRFKICEYE